MSKPKKKCWSQSFGGYGSTIRVAEREPGGVLYLLWVDNTGKQRKRSLGHRDRRRGKQTARIFAQRMAAIREARSAARSTPAEADGLTLAEGIELAFHPEEGMYPTESRHTRESRRLLDRALGVLGAGLPWTDLRPRKVRHLARTLARRSVDGKGLRSVELMCDMLYSVAAWLREEELISERAALPARSWKAKLKSDWEGLTGTSISTARPRHEIEEVGRIFAALPQADPRLRLLIELAAELRAGQAVRARRSDLVLDPVGGFGLGRFTVRGAGRKGGEVVDLHPELRDLVEHVLTTGYLSDAEAAYRQGVIQNYFLFPVGRLRAGKARLENCVKQPLMPRTIRDMFQQLEVLAGVEHQAGRAFYGLRRTATDVAPEFESDDRVLDRLTGHRDSETRKRVYQDRESDRVRARAATVRRTVRQYLIESGTPAA